jgi:1,4-alpha-glucan branching enzyme
VRAEDPAARAHTRTRARRGRLAIVLHTHMPYVEGFGTWPFGEEWLWEAMVGCYLPLLELLERDAPLTLSLTPVLCDQLQAPGVAERFERFVGDVRRHTHEEDARGLRAGGHEQLARELERSWKDYEWALHSFTRHGGDLLAALAPYAQWTSAATHAVLPLLASEAALRLQVQVGVDSHRARFQEPWRGGFWLPECAHAPYLEPALADAGVHATCVELTGRLGLGAPAHLRPLVGDAGVVLAPIDRATIALVWSDEGYPADGGYRDYHRHTVHHHNPWANDGGAYDRERALARAREHAADFVSRTRARLSAAGEGPRAEALPDGGLAVCALDTELLGHWWYEGIEWLGAVVEECARQGLELVRLDDALERCEPALVEQALRHAVRSEAPSAALRSAAHPAARRGAAHPAARRGAAHPAASDAEDAACAGVLQPSTWGAGGDLSTWSGPAVAEIAFATRAAELDVLRAGSRAGEAAVRELLALQSSDWAFMVARGLAVPYARERFEHHRAALARALAEGPDADTRALRELAVHAGRSTLLSP